MNKYLTLQNIVITTIVIFFMIIGAIGAGLFTCTGNNAHTVALIERVQ